MANVLKIDYRVEVQGQPVATGVREIKNGQAWETVLHKLIGELYAKYGTCAIIHLTLNQLRPQ